METEQEPQYKRTIKEAVSQETAFMVEDYPYGFRLRTKIRYWIETTKRGQRFVSQTLNPKTNTWNTPKKSVYSAIMCMIELNNGHISYDCIDFNTPEKRINDFFDKHNLTDEYSLKKKRELVAWDRGLKHIKFEVVKDSEAERQTPEEQSNIINKAVRYEYYKGIKEGTL